MGRTRTERDSLGELEVPAEALWGAQTQRAIDNFRIADEAMPAGFIRALAQVKATAAEVNQRLGLLDEPTAAAIVAAAEAIAAGEHADQFPVSVFQTGSGTSTNMNANEVIARRASRDSGADVHPNDHVNLGQSSNDVIPTTTHVSAAIAVRHELLPALEHLRRALNRKAARLRGVVKTGRTHLMDAMPLRMDQEIGAWATQVGDARERIESALPRLHALAQGATAVGTGINAHPKFARSFAHALSTRVGIRFRPADDPFAAIACADACVELHGQLKAAAVSLTKIANDLRWMNSGPLAGLAEIELKALQPGSSIMPGKVNPVIPEAVAMACAQVIGNDACVTLAGASGNFQLNVMWPVIAANLLRSIGLVAGASRALADQAVADFQVNSDRLEAALAANPILVTALNERIGYDQGAAIAKQAYAEGRAIIDVAEECTDIPRAELEQLLDPRKLTGT